jgi:hypothetical protein
MLENKEIFSNKLIREVSAPGHNYSVSNNTFGAHIDDCKIRVLTSEEKDFRIKLLANDLQIRDDKLDLLDLSLRDAADEITNLNRTISNLMGQYEAERSDKDSYYKKRASKLERHIKELTEHVKGLSYEICQRDEKFKAKLAVNKKTHAKTSGEKEQIKIEWTKSINHLESKEKELEKLHVALESARYKYNEVHDRYNKLEGKFNSLISSSKTSDLELASLKKRNKEGFEKYEKDLEKLQGKLRKKDSKAERLGREKDSVESLLFEARKEINSKHAIEADIGAIMAYDGTTAANKGFGLKSESPLIKKLWTTVKGMKANEKFYGKQMDKIQTEMDSVKNGTHVDKTVRDLSKKHEEQMLSLQLDVKELVNNYESELAKKNETLVVMEGDLQK